MCCDDRCETSSETFIFKSCRYSLDIPTIFDFRILYNYEYIIKFENFPDNELSPELIALVFSHKAAQNNDESVKEKTLPPVNDYRKSLPVIFLRSELKCVDLDEKRSDVPFYNLQKFKEIVKQQTSSSENSKAVTASENDILESQVKTISNANIKKLPKNKLLNAVNLQDLEWREQILDTTKVPSYYAKLSKIRLTGLVVATAVAGYIMAPAAFNVTSFAAVTVGTGLMSGAANSFNQFFEVPFDSQMSRTKNRVLVKGFISELHAVSFAIASGIAGLSILFFWTNALTVSLGAMNLFLYACVYTPMKRYSIINTWIGSFVGAIPPMMGWAACTGSLDTGAWFMAGLLYAWQFPHFNALSWNLRPDYSRAGYRMMSVINPELCKKTAFRYSIGILVLSSLAPVLDVTTWMFAIDSLPLNAFFVYRSWQFKKNGDSSSSRKLFLLSLIHLPALMILLIISKKHYSRFSEEENTDRKISEISNLNYS
ncbi:Protoheme IX farnesyltransferase, mitochondrial [Nymphon striatum]|nr:Protoheme IX farnesyltransferase, mitochondrial [Nymphon striatum]